MITQLQSRSDVAGVKPSQPLRRTPPAEYSESSPHCVDIGLINNMPDAALDATERQFRALLTAAADNTAVRLGTSAGA